MDSDASQQNVSFPLSVLNHEFVILSLVAVIKNWIFNIAVFLCTRFLSQHNLKLFQKFTKHKKHVKSMMQSL